MNIFFVEPNDSTGGGFISRNLYKYHIVTNGGYSIVHDIKKADLVHGYGPGTIPTVANLGHKYGIPCFVNLNGIKYSPSMSYYKFHRVVSPRYYRNLFLLKKYIPLITHFFTLNTFFRDHWVSDGVPRDRVTIIPNMIDNTFPVYDRYESSTIKMLYIGEHSHYRLPQVADTVYKCLKQDFDCSLTTIYNGVKYQYMPEIYRSHDVYLQPMKFPICTTRTLIESMTYGLCPILYGSPYYSSIVEDTKSGVLIDSIDTGFWIDSVTALFSNQSRIKNMGDNARRRVWEVCHPQKIIRMYSNVYEGCVT